MKYTSQQDQFMRTVTKVLRATTKIAIRLNTKFFGVECDIYYPKGFGSYSGHHDDIDFSPEPDDHQRLLIPSIYSMRMNPQAGVQDIFQEDFFTCYHQLSVNLPYYSKIVCLSETNGQMEWLVEKAEGITTNIDKIYKVSILSPFVNYRNNDSDINSITNELLEQKIKEDQKILDSLGNSLDPDNESAQDSPIPKDPKRTYKFDKFKRIF